MSNSLGGDWTVIYDGPDDVSLHTFVLVGFGGFLAAGTVTTTNTACVLTTDWTSETWTMVEPLAESGQLITDVGRRVHGPDLMGLLFVATVEAPFTEQGKVLVSADGLTWVEVFISAGHESTYSITDHDDQLWIGGTGGRVYASPDGMNWTRFHTPANQSRLVAMYSVGYTLVAHGFNDAAGLGAQTGVATSDGGKTWQEFPIGFAYEPRGLAYGNGRWVSVGQSLADPGKGAIFTTE